MYRVSKRMEVSGAHRLDLPYLSQCTNLHGHSWIITVYCSAPELNPEGMVVDFMRIKKLIHGRLDHQCLNDVLPFNPTAENIARWVQEEINRDILSDTILNGSAAPRCYRVDVQESEGNIATYEED